MSKQFDLEQSILDCWHITDDLKALTSKYDELSEDQKLNILIGLIDLYQIKFENCFSDFEDYLKEVHKGNKVPPSPSLIELMDRFGHWPTPEISGKVHDQNTLLETKEEQEGPIEDDYGSKFWYKNGKLHREDGPAVEGISGSKYWYKNGQLHREDGPAVEYTDGSKLWWLHGQRHREDGPAVEYYDGTKEWWLYGRKVNPF